MFRSIFNSSKVGSVVKPPTVYTAGATLSALLMRESVEKCCVSARGFGQVFEFNSDFEKNSQRTLISGLEMINSFLKIDDLFGTFRLPLDKNKHV